MDTEIILPILCGAAVHVWAIIYRTRRDNEQNNKMPRQLWKDLSRSMGGEFHVSSDWWRSKPDRFEVSRDGVPISVTWRRGAGGRSGFDTVLLAHVEDAADLRLQLDKRGPLSVIEYALGAQDIQVGDLLFDQSYVVKSNDEDIARAWLQPALRERLRKSPLSSLTLKDGVLEGRIGGLEEDPRRLEAALQGIAAFVVAGRTLRKGWQLVAHKLGVAPRKKKTLPGLVEEKVLSGTQRGVPFSIEIVHQPPPSLARAQIRQGTVVQAGLLTVMRPFHLVLRGLPFAAGGLGEEEAPAPLHVGYQLYAEDPEGARRALSQRLRSCLQSASPTLLSVRGQTASLFFAGIIIDAERLTSAVDALTEIAAGQAQGPYR